MQSDRYLDKAKGQLSLKSIFSFEGRDIQLVAILSAEPRFEANWYKGKEVHLIGVDSYGNFFLRHSSGSVKYWDHKTTTLTDVAPSIKAFVAQLRTAKNGSIGGADA